MMKRYIIILAVFLLFCTVFAFQIKARPYERVADVEKLWAPNHSTDSKLTTTNKGDLVNAGIVCQSVFEHSGLVASPVSEIKHADRLTSQEKSFFAENLRTPPPVVPVAVDKYAVPVTDPDNPNAWDVTLKITTEAVTVPVDVVIVIDQSSSMGGQNIARLKSAIASGQRFVKKMLPKGNATEGVRIALVSYDHEPHFLSDFTKDTAFLCQKIRALTPIWGTHTQGGLKVARNIMATSNAVDKHIILMSDGLATEQYPVKNVTTADFIGKTGNANDPIDLVIQGAINFPTNYVSNNPSTPLTPNYPTQSSKVGRRDLPESKFDYSSLSARITFDGVAGALVYEPKFGHPYYYYFPCNAAINEAQFAKSSGYTIHTIGYDLGNFALANNSLKLTATDENHFFTATPQNLAAAFDNIAQTINIGIQKGVVTDFVAPGFIVKNVTQSGDVTHLVKVTNGTVHYDITTRKLTWTTGTILSSSEATLTYRIFADIENMDQAQINNVSTIGPDLGGYDTNKEAKLNYTNSNGEANQCLLFPRPTVKPGYGVIKRNYVLVNMDGQPILADGTVVGSLSAAQIVHSPDFFLPPGNDYIAPKWIKLDKTNDNLQYFSVTPSAKNFTYNGKFYRFTEVPGSTLDGANIGISWKHLFETTYFAYLENRPPVAVPDVNTTFVDIPVRGNVLTNDYDPEKDPIHVTPQVNIPTQNGGHVTINADGSYVYTPSSNYVGEDTFTYEVCDNHNACTSTTVTIEVLPLPVTNNNPPVAVNDNYLMPKGGVLNGNVITNDFDPDGDLNPNSVTLVDGGTAQTNGTLTLNADGTFTYVPNPGFVGDVNFKYQVCDHLNRCDDAVVTIKVLPDTENSTFAADDAFITTKYTPVTGNVLANDYDAQGNNQIVNTTLVAIPQYGNVVISADGTFTYTPTNGYVGPDRFVYCVCDDGTPKACDKATVYILIKPAANYWIGGTLGMLNKWNEPNNWTNNIVPAVGENIEFATEQNNPTQANNPKSGPAKQDLHLDDIEQDGTEGRVIGNLINHSDKNLVITTGNQLMINGVVEDNNAVAGTIVVKSSKDNPTGTLLFRNPGANQDVGATVEFYNQGYDCADCGMYRRSWQYFGIPVNESLFPYEDVAGEETVNQWVEPFNGDKWRPAPYAPDTQLQKFKGYQITNDVQVQPTGVYGFKGIICVCDAFLNLTRTPNVNYSGSNLVGNSYTAAIDIRQGIVFPPEVEETVYLFNTGTRDQWRKLNGSTVSGYQAGQYLSVPKNTAGQSNLPDRIPSMHSFLLKMQSGASCTLQILYDKLMKNTTVNNGNGAQIVWRSNDTGSSGMPSLVMDVLGNESADRLWIFTEPGLSFGFDNGWDGRKLPEKGLSQLYALSDIGNDKFQVAAVPELDNLQIGFDADKDGQYTLEFALSDHFSKGAVYLHDLQTESKHRITNTTSYSFEAKRGDSGARFRLSFDEAGVDSEEVSVVVGTVGKRIVVSNNSAHDYTVQIYTTDGKLLFRGDVKAGGKSMTEALTDGAYVVSLHSPTTATDVRKLIVN
ncbi:Ig-like domain-containing protein [Porphyromonas gulae]|uniref:Ig-like domain-containing protein n=1 Tax=Porphyromonas gulae TaxID=111105 RepID=UPI000A442819|nr:Ig-like domain-containing protein [Porphyromonas gulae]